MRLSTAFFVFISLALFSSCLTPTTEYSRVAPGMWRGVIELEPYIIPVRDKDSIFVMYDNFKEGDLPFNFEVKYLDDEQMVFEFINGNERIRCDSISYGRDRSQARDTFNIYFPEYQSYIHAEVRGGAMQGYWEVSSKNDYRLPFKAKAGQDFRFTNNNEPPVADLTGKWAAHFGLDKEGKPEKAIGEFRQEGNQILGTFRTETGDYRYLEGTVQGRKFWLSCFDGSHAFRFSGSINGDTLNGEFRSGKHYRTLWEAWKDPGFELGDPDSLTSYDASIPLSFEFSTPDGGTISYPSAYFEDKVRIFTIMGTWCPNCKDEQNFLRDYLSSHPEQAEQIRVVSFAFERAGDTSRINEHLKVYRDRMKLPYPVVHAGQASKEEAVKVFPQLNHVLAFPTMMIIDKNGLIRKVHTGFDGPATSKYQEHKDRFSALLEEILATD